MQHFQEASIILHDIQVASVRSGRDKITMDEIDAEILAYRKEKGAKAPFIQEPALFLKGMLSNENE